MTPGSLAWDATARLTAPFWRLHLRRRARRNKEIPARLQEREGGGAARPPGRLLWLHGASVGESLSILPLIEALARRDPALRFLVTTGTVTSAELLMRRLPETLRPRLQHRFVPLDVPDWADRFLQGWRPDAGVFVESEVWPNLLAATRRARIPMLLVNARLSERSARGWRWAPGLAREAFSTFRLVLAQSEADAARLRAAGAGAVRVAGNLKYAASPLPADAAELARLRRLVGARPVLFAASTHAGEEELLARTHERLAARLPGLLTVIAPRHPERGAELAAQLPGAVRRGAGGEPGPETGLYLADTLGELGLFYRLAGVAVIGKSLLAPGGGQNPLEPARLGCPILLGPHMGNFADVTARLLAAGGAVQLPPSPAPSLSTDPAMLADAAHAVLTDTRRAELLRQGAARVAEGASGLAEEVARTIAELLPEPPSPGIPRECQEERT